MYETDFVVYDGVEVPVSVLLRPERHNRYGTIEDLPEEELVDPDELERVVYKQMWWPILRLPQQRWECPIRPNMDEDGKVNWGAFGTVDFESYRPQFSKLRYKVQKLKERLKDLVMTCEMIRDRIQGLPIRKILKRVREGVLDPDDIKHWDMWQLALTYLRAYHLRQEIERLQRVSRQQQEEKTQEFWASLGC